MSTPCFATIDTARHYSKQESDEQRRNDALITLAGEYMAAATLPLLTTVSTPGSVRKRVPFLERFADELGVNALTARMVSILMRSEEGKALMQEMAQAHAEWFVDDAMVTG